MNDINLKYTKKLKTMEKLMKKWDARVDYMERGMCVGNKRGT